MSPKEKAIDLRDKMFLKIPAVYDPTCTPHFPIAKEMALVAIEEIIEAVRGMVDEENGYSCSNYYFDVRKEIWKL